MISKEVEKFGRETLNDLERLKRAEESEPMAVLVIPWPKSCNDCHLNYMGLCMDTAQGVRQCVSSREDHCRMTEAIGIIEPGCHVKYFGEDET